MGRKSRRLKFSGASIETVTAMSKASEEEVASSSPCTDCLRAQGRLPGKTPRGHRRRPAVRTGTPIVVHLKDTIKVSVKGKMKSSPQTSDPDTDSSSSDDVGRKTRMKHSFLHSGIEKSRDCKNFNALLSAIEKVHLKDDQNLAAKNLQPTCQLCASKEKASGYLLNNCVHHHPTTSKAGDFVARTLELIQKPNVDLICNDLHSESSGSQSKNKWVESELSSQSSASSRSESPVEWEGSSTSESEELCKEELEELTHYTTGYAITKYNCWPHECPHCLALYMAHTHCYADTYDWVKVEVFGDENSTVLSQDLGPSQGNITVDIRNFPVKVTGKGKVEVSVASLHENSPQQTRGRLDTQCSDTILLDLTNSEMSYSVSSHMSSHHPAEYRHAITYPDFFHHFYMNMFGYLPYFVPYYMMPPNFPPFPTVTVHKPLCLPRDLKCLSSRRLCLIPAHEVKHFTSSEPPQRPWVAMAHPQNNKPVAIFTVMCYNVLCDKYATRQLYGYCPQWALNWDYRKKAIMEDIRQYLADIISLQEVETEQFYNFFLPELKSEGYDGIFSPKSRAKTMACESDRKHVDGCAIFFKTSKFSLVKDYLIEFNQLAISTAEGSHDMINRVMTKDNIGLAALLETREGVWDNELPAEGAVRQPLLVATCHIHWDPEYSDVKLIQTMMLMSALKNIIEESQTSFRPGSSAPDCNSLPLLLCGDLNSLPDSGVVDFLNVGKVPANHEDFKDMGYQDCLQKLSSCDTKEIYSHSFKLAQAYSDDIMPYTNYTYDFKGIIDYIFYSRDFMRPLGVLGRLDQGWFEENKVLGCPHPHVPSDHLPLLVEFEMAAHGPSSSISSSSRQTSAHTVARR